MRILFKNEEEFNCYKDTMKDLFGDSIKFQTAIDMATKKETKQFIIKTKSGKRIKNDVVFEGELESTADNNSFLEQRINNLKEEAKLLDKKIAKSREDENYGTYKNLINAYSEILRLIDRYDWKLMYSEYRTDGKKQVAVWEQNGEGIIRNHKIWDVVESEISVIPADRVCKKE